MNTQSAAEIAIADVQVGAEKGSIKPKLVPVRSLVTMLACSPSVLPALYPPFFLGRTDKHDHTADQAGRLCPPKSVYSRAVGWVGARDSGRAGRSKRNFGIWRANDASTVMILNPGCQRQKRMIFDDPAMRAHCRPMIRVLSRPTTKAGVRRRPAGRTPKGISSPPQSTFFQMYCADRHTNEENLCAHRGTFA